MPEAWVVAVLMRIEPAADFHVLLDDHDLLTALGQIAGADHTVMARADYDAVVF
jgi:hypothetical protein